MKNLVNRLLPQASFARSVGVLVGGTALAQGIGVLALPLLTRLYTPTEFSVLAVYLSILGIFAGIACLRLDIAIPLPELDEDASNLLATALLCSASTALLAALTVWLFSDGIVNGTSQPGLTPYLWMIPLGIWLTSAYSAVQLWATRKKRFNAIAQTKVGQMIGNTTIQLSFGLSNTPGAFGLLFGQLIGSAAGVLGLGRAAWREDRHVLRKINLTDMRRVFRVYDRFPKFSTLEALANSGAIQLPVIIIAAASKGPEAGYLLLAMQAMATPVGLIGTSVSQVYLSRAPEAYRAGELGPFTLKAIAGLMKIGAGPLLFAGIVSPIAFPLVFGADWQRAGEMVIWMTPWFLLQYLCSPVSMSLHVTNNLRTALQLQIFGFILRVGGTWLATLLTPKYVFETYAITGFIFYFAYLVVVARITKIKAQNLLLASTENLRTIIVWTLIGIGIASITPLLSEVIASQIASTQSATNVSTPTVFVDFSATSIY